MNSHQRRKNCSRLTFHLLVILGSFAATCVASETNRTQTAKSPPVKGHRQPALRTDNSLELTGSRLKTPVRRFGRITDGPCQVVVIDRAAIDRSGGADLKQVLGLQGIR